LEVSQYTFSDAGASACTAIAASVAQFILPKLKSEQFQDVLNPENLTECIYLGVGKFSELNSGALNHVAVDELGNAFFDQIHSEGEVFQGLITVPGAFQSLFEEAENRCHENQYIGVIVTKPPETICLIIPSRRTTSSTSTSEQKYFLFDSHSRPEQGINGSYLVVSTSRESIISRLETLFPTLDGMDSEDTFSYMYNMFEGNFFVAN
jgi:hypothetical protein